MNPLQLAAGLVLACSGACFAQALKDESRLLDKPSGAPQGAALSAGTQAKVIERQGFWVRVEAAGRSGWLKASSLSFSSGAGGPAVIDTGRLGTGNIVSSSAARGLSAKDLLNGSPRPDEVARLNQLASDAPSARAFAAEGRLVALAQPVALKVPTPAASRAAAPTEAAPGKAADPPSTPKKKQDDW